MTPSTISSLTIKSYWSSTRRIRPDFIFWRVPINRQKKRWHEESVDSVEFLDEDDISDLKKKQAAQINVAKAFAKYEDEVLFLESVMRGGVEHSQSELHRMLQDEELNPNDALRRLCATAWC